MTLSGGIPRRKRFIRPNALFLGIAFSFLVCCLTGYSSSRRNLFRYFERFHRNLNFSTNFFPTASELHELGKAELDPNKVAVIVGGNSVTYGFGQMQTEVWTRKLQEELGDDYRVLNLAMWGAYPHEFGGVGAEMLSRERQRLIYITTCFPAIYPGRVTSGKNAYVYWDAYYKGLLRSYPEREEAIKQYEKKNAESAQSTEQHARGRMNSWCYFDDLWTAVTYRDFGTVWTPLMPDDWYRARRDFRDVHVTALPRDQRYGPELMEPEMKRVRANLSHGGCRKDDKGRWVEDPAAPVWPSLVGDARECFPEADRKRTLLVVTTESPYYLNLLTADEREQYFALTRVTADKLEGAGFSALDMGGDFTVDDFADRCHLTASGGARLADKVAGRVQRLAVELGYVDGNKGNAP
jgi:hypothetical protein